jgi:hypothetical protein
MSLHEYQYAIELDKADAPFYGLIMAAMLRADGDNIVALRSIFPETYQELDMRYNTPGARLPGELGAVDG